MHPFDCNAHVEFHEIIMQFKNVIFSLIIGQDQVLNSVWGINNAYFFSNVCEVGPLDSSAYPSNPKQWLGNVSPFSFVVKPHPPFDMFFLHAGPTKGFV